MNEKNECVKLGASHMEGREREGAPDLPALSRRASVGPIVLHQALLKDDITQEQPMDISTEGLSPLTPRMSGATCSPGHQASSAGHVRTSPSVNSAVNSPSRVPGLAPVDIPPLTATSPLSGLAAAGGTFNSAARKRLKMSDGSAKPVLSEDLATIHRKNIDERMATLKALKERYTECIAQVFYLQSGGVVMDYQAWRKRPLTPQLLAFMRAHPLEGAGEGGEPPALQPLTPSVPVPTPAPSPSPSPAPQGAEIKIPGVGVTPVAVSTQLPAAVAQLTQQGSVPGRPAGGRHGMVFAPHRPHHSVATPRLPGGTPLVVENNTGVGRTSNSTAPAAVANASLSSSQEQIVEKAKQEAYVMQRICELQKEGLWTEKRLPKVVEPPRPKAHWDYLLEEMVWLAADFAQERKWKKAAAKKCARMVQKHFQEKALAAQRAEKAQEHQLKRIAAFVAKEIRLFWSNVEKLVEFKQQTRLEEQRKQALDQQLSFIVDQTEKYSQQLAEGMRSQAQHSKQNSSKGSNTSACQSDEEFCPSGAVSSDDEETIAAAEKEDTTDNAHKDEIEALQRESQMELDEFLNELPKDYLENRDKIKISDDESSDKSEDDAEFKADEDSSDDEDTIMEQEKAEGNDDHKKEIDDLNAENEMSIEELRKKYSGSPPPDSPPTSASESEDLTEDEEEDREAERSSGSEEEDVDESLNVLVQEGSENQSEDHRMEDAAAIAESIQPTGNTLSSTQVVTEVPHLLKHTLREYQHIGLDWLVTMEQRRLNGILADEMGLGKTIQTIALLAHLACEKADWGPHLIVVPTSVMLNWEMEFMKWCPGFKILTYYGSQKERKLKRIGWTKPNAFHICITSYKLVIQDHQSFRRKKWKYLILDEAQNIKNFKSQRWQLLLNFQTQQRLLLTGTPLQNNLMELWSLMHFLMPDIFASHREFKEWFSNPVTGMIEGNSEYNENIIKRLHKVLRPFLLRRLKSEVEKQMPKKYEHIIMCRLSKRQRFLYDDFMSRAKTRETLACGNLLSVINILMQLRKVCNHPNLFEVRPIISPFQMEAVDYHIPSLVYNMMAYQPLESLSLSSMNLNLLHIERNVSAFESHHVRLLKTSPRLIEEVDSIPPPPPPCPKAALRIHVSVRNVPLSPQLPISTVNPGTSPRISATDLAKRNSRPTRPVVRLQNGEVPAEGLSVSTPRVHALSQPVTPAILRQLVNARTAPVPPVLRDKSKAEPVIQSEFRQPTLEELLKTRRKSLLHMLNDINTRRCDAWPLYGLDLREACAVPPVKFCTTIQNDVSTVESYAKGMSDIFKRFVVYICGAMSPGIKAHVSHGLAWKVQEEKSIDSSLINHAKPIMNLVHPIKTQLSTYFPDPRLIQYDCGKLQTLDRLLRKLRSDQHRVLIFTQMTKMLDVLEAFLNFHGHIYLRLDGTTKVEQRQVLMERFNSDPRIFVFILSTRSGGVGVNLTGADTVIFYDSDWNPTMDAQAQDRCHRIGQTRDVHIYRLVSEKTIEENILKKANQKRMLGDVAIEGGNFTTAYFKSSTIQDLFAVGSDEDPSHRMEVQPEEDSTVADKPAGGVTALENALAWCEDEADVAAAQTARAEAAADLAEFDESIPLEEQPQPEQPELSKAEMEVQALMQQLSPVELYAMRMVEASEAATFAEQQAAAEMEKQKRDWEAARRLLERPPTPPLPEPDPAVDELLTFSRQDSVNQVWLSQDGCERMPMWCPPTPPQGEDDVYIDVSLGYLYDWNIMSEAQLPPVFIKRENKRPRADTGLSPDGRRPLKIRKEESVYAPRSLFERPSPALMKMRRDLKLQKYRGIVRPPVPVPGIKPTPRPHVEPETVPEWMVTEDMALMQAVKSQGLPLNLIILSPAHTPNWDLVSDLVNNTSRIYRSPRQCRNRYETIILPREEGLYDANQKKQKKTKGVCKTTTKGGRPMRTSQLYEQDNNVSFTQSIQARYDTMKFILNKKTTTPKRRYDDPTMKNPKHAAVLSEYGVNYDSPPSPMEIATRRAERIAKEKQKAAPVVAPVVPSGEQPQQSGVSRLQGAGTGAAPSPPPVPSAAVVPPAAAASPAPTIPVVRAPHRLVQQDPLQRTQRIVVAPQQVASVVPKGTVTAGGKPLRAAQLQYLQQQTLARQMKVFHHQQQGAGQPGLSGVSAGAKATVPVSVATIQVSGAQQRPQITAQTVGKQTIARTVTDADINALIKRQQAIAQQKAAAAIQPVTQIFTQQQLQGVAGGSGVAKSGVVAGVGGGKPGAPLKVPVSPHIRQMQLQQQLALAQRKGPKVTQLAQVAGGTQVIVQAGAGAGAAGAHKALPSVTMQQIQQVMRQIPQAGARVLPRPTIQVVGGNMGQMRTAGTSAQAGHTQVILSQVSAALQRQPAQAGIRPPQPNTQSDQQSKQ